ncbi:39832_t:CDS:2 [Gigaspora margarita]|uniref:Trafficking protein particle complex subunit n=1 Tax=Gigaspora margarita TaxID=4874 RepID=A0ABN7UN24_GIGMA|nr:39832_t:CDS:2 [Gigaspora margarita]
MYQKDFNEGLAHLTANEYLVFAGTKFLIIADPTHANIDLVLRRTYDVYSDYVMKNPFYTPEMPIRSELFDVNIVKLIKQVGG